MEDICLSCKASLEGSPEQCPACGAAIVYCANMVCGLPLLTTTEVCPYCGDRNLEFVPPDPDPDPEAESQPGPGPEPEPTSGPDSDPPAATAGASNQTDIAEQAAVMLRRVFSDTPAADGPARADVDDSGDDARSARPSAAVIPGAQSPGVPQIPDGAPIADVSGDDGAVPQALDRIPADAPVPVRGGGRGSQVPISASGAGGVSGMSSLTGSCPVTLEFDSAVPFEVDSKGLIRLRIGNAGLAPGARAVVTVEASPELRLRDPGPIEASGLGSVRPRELPPLSCVPACSGVENVSVCVSVVSGDAELLSRWRATCVLRVSRADAQSRIDINVTGDLIDMSSKGSSFVDAVGLGQDARGQSVLGGRWQRLELQPDDALNERLERAVAPVVVPMPVPPRELTAAETESPWLGVRRGHENCVIFLGDHVECQRPVPQGSPGHGSRFMIAADNGDPTATRRISGSRGQARFRISGGRAWVMDLSSNGTWLNDERLPQRQWHVLLTGDRLVFSKFRVASLEVALQADSDGVYALCLTQRKSTGSVQTFVLCARGLFWPEAGASRLASTGTGVPGTWLRTLPDTERRWVLHATTGPAWQPVPAAAAETTCCGWTWVAGYTT